MERMDTRVWVPDQESSMPVAARIRAPPWPSSSRTGVSMAESRLQMERTRQQAMSTRNMGSARERARAEVANVERDSTRSGCWEGSHRIPDIVKTQQADSPVEI